MNKISVIICTYNRSETLMKTLESFLAQENTAGFEYEVIVVDNNSKDNTKSVIEGYISKFNKKLIYLQETKQGLSHARNRGIKETEGNIVAFTDDDCIVDRTWLATIDETFADHGVDCAGGKIIPLWTKEKPSWLTNKFYGKLALMDYGDNPFQIINDEYDLFGANMVFRKILFDKYGGFQTDLGRQGKKLLNGEDSVYIKMLIDNKAKVFYQPKMVVSHLITEERLKKNYFTKWHYYAGISTASMDKDEKVKKVVFNIPRHMLGSFLRAFIQYFISIFKCRDESFYFQCRLLYYLSYFIAKIGQYFKPFKLR